MKISVRFRLRHALPALVLLVAAPVYAQDNTGNKPEIVAPAVDQPVDQPVAQPAAPNSAMAEHAAPGHKDKLPSTTLTISLKSETPTTLPAAGGRLSLGDKTLTLSAAEITALTHETVSVANGHTNATETYAGVPIAVLLARLGLPFEKANEHTLLKTYLVAEGTDGYHVLTSVYETLSTIRGTGAIVADALVTSEGPKPLTSDGAFKLIVPGDKRPQRWVQNLKSITFKTID